MFHKRFSRGVTLAAILFALLFATVSAHSLASTVFWGKSTNGVLAPSQTYTLSGRVYEGETGVGPPGSTPLQGVTVSLYCSNNAAQKGTFLRSTTTDVYGWYGLPVYDRDVCEFFNIVETDPVGYTSNGASTVGGNVVDVNWIEYAAPLRDKTLTGNKFWDQREATNTPTPTRVGAATDTPTPTPTPTPTRVSAATNTSTPTPTPTRVSAATNTPTPTPIVPATSTPTATPTNIVNPTPTPTATPTPHSVPPGSPDFGDAPTETNHAHKVMFAYPGVVATFPTVYDPAISAFGPVHRHPRQGPWLGTRVTLEEDADRGADEDGVNNIDPAADRSNQDRGDDGLVEWPPFPHCEEFHGVEVAVTFPPSAPAREYYLNIWVDWNHNGTWGDELDCGFTAVSEWAVRNMPVPPEPAGVHYYAPEFMAWQDGTDRPTWVRITLSERPAEHPDGSGPSDGYDYGETEDYYLGQPGQRIYLPIVLKP